MRKIDLKIGFSCNNSCKFCVQGDKRKSYKDKSFEEVHRILRENKKDSDSIVFTGGESTIYPYFLKSVSAARSLGFKKIQIQTNGRLFAYKDFCIEAIKAGANEFCFAIHGHNAKVHDYLTGCPGSFRQSTKGVENLKSLGARVACNTVVTTPNFTFLPQIARLLVRLKIDQFQFAFPHILGKAAENKNWLIPRISKVIKYIKSALDIGIKAGRVVMTEAVPYCFMQGYEDYIAERIIPETTVFDADLIVRDYGKYRKEKGKTKGALCRKCRYYGNCEGPWREYPEIFGWGEFKPVKPIKSCSLIN